MVALRSVCVFCGSSTPPDAHYRDAARALGVLVARRGIGLVYGGGRVGLMGELADAALRQGGRVTGVIPAGLFSREIGHVGLTELREVGSMHERKQLMYDLSDAFVALPGGLGTLEELAEVATWSQLGLHAHRMRYQHFRSLGMFVGSGAVEAGCKAVVGQRLKLSGMKWSQAGATGILTLRCLQASNRWEEIWAKPSQTPAA